MKPLGRSKALRKSFLFVLTLGGLFLFHKTGLWDFFSDQARIQAFIESCGIWDEVAFVLLQAVQVILPSIPGAILNIIGGYLYGTILGVLWSTIGTTVGAYIAFSLSRRFGKPLTDRFFNVYIMRRIESAILRKGNFTIFLLFLIPGFPKDYLCYIIGLGRISTKEFLIIASMGRLFGTILETMGGDFLRHWQYGKIFLLVGTALSTILIVVKARDKIENAFDMLRGIRSEKE